MDTVNIIIPKRLALYIKNEKPFHLQGIPWYTLVVRKALQTGFASGAPEILAKLESYEDTQGFIFIEKELSNDIKLHYGVVIPVVKKALLWYYRNDMEKIYFEYYSGEFSIEKFHAARLGG